MNTGAPVLSGQTLGGRYQLGELLGKGGWGAVYAATQTDLGRAVAVKVLSTEAAMSSEGLARFEREARAAAALGHPNIAQVTDFQARPGEPAFLVMERLAGATMGAELRRLGRMPPVRVAWIAYQILAALDAAHRAGIVHRDVKPDNVFLVSVTGVEDFVKLLDFGIAKLTDATSPQLTSTDTSLGSPAYMAPEQVKQAAIDPRVDLYAVGATMFHAISGRIPFEAQTLHALLLAITEERPKTLRELDPMMDPTISGIVERALAKDPNARFQSAAEMRAALEPLLGNSARIGHMAPSSALAPSTISPLATPTFGIQPSRKPGTEIGTAPPHLGPPPNPPALLHQPPPNMTPPNVSAPPQVAMPPAGGYGAPAVSAPPVAYGPPPPMPGPPPATMQSAPQAPPPVAAQPAKGSGAVVVLLVVIIVLLVVLGGGAAAAFFLLRSSDAPQPVASTSASSTLPASTGTAPTATGSNAAVTPSGVPSAKRLPGAAPPSPIAVLDAGPAPNVPPPAAPDAGPPPGARKQMGGTKPYISGGEFGKYDIDKSRAAVEAQMGAITACYAATEFDPPDHQFNYYFLNIDPSGNVTSVAPVTDTSNHAKLNACLFPALRRAHFQAVPGGGQIKMGFTARTRDNP